MEYGRDRNGLEEEWWKPSAVCDYEGSAVTAVRMDADAAYEGIYQLLQRFINEGDLNAWDAITEKIDYIYDNLDYVLANLDYRTQYGNRIQEEVRRGKKLVFKPNIVAPNVIDPNSHGEGAGAIACTEWPLLAAVMRWFHDTYHIYYSQMAMAEASSSTFLIADYLSKSAGTRVTTEGLLEGRYGDLYGGYGFYFVRKYLSERLLEGSMENPMDGYEESVTGTYVEPGRSGHRLLVYDLNKVTAFHNRGRYVAVPDGENFSRIMFHKVIIGGDPCSEEDQKEYPGCVLINMPKCKMHAQDLLTNAIKNIGIGLYPSGYESEEGHYKYAVMSGEKPGLKGGLPHSRWVFEMDEQTGLPKIDCNGNYSMKRTGGLSASQIDAVKAIQNQGVFMIHISDAIHTINLSHDPDGHGVRIKEGMVWASLDCVALDLCCARYCFKTVPMEEARAICATEGLSTEFLQYVPVARIDGLNIVTKTGVDSPLLRYLLYDKAEKRGVGDTCYYMIGFDTIQNAPFRSIDGHLICLFKEGYAEVMTETLYYNLTTFLHDMQNTVFSYAMASDILNETSLMKELLEMFDENKDGVIDYEEKGRGIETAVFSIISPINHLTASTEFGAYQSEFQLASTMLRNSEQEWNEWGHTYTKERLLVSNLLNAYQMSQQDTIMPDLFFEGMSYGKGLWPSFYTVCYTVLMQSLYGGTSFERMSLSSMYGNLFQYVDKAYANGRYTGSKNAGESKKGALKDYINDVKNGWEMLDFIFYVPEGYGNFNDVPIPNVEETADREKMFHAYFNQAQDGTAEEMK